MLKVFKAGLNSPAKAKFVSVLFVFVFFSIHPEFVFDQHSEKLTDLSD